MYDAAARRVPGRLAAPEPGWSTRADVVIIGSGIAGLTAALRLKDEVDKILVVTKDVLSAGSTQWAQGGIAAALGPGDTPEQHETDTLVAGAGACDLDAVRILVNEGPEAVRELIALGTNFDHDDDGVISLTREGGHLRDRIAHAGGDATGAEIQRALIAAVAAAPEIEVIQHALAVDLLLADDGGVAGVTLHVMGEGQRDGVGAVHCRAVVLATGGLGQVFSQTTNPARLDRRRDGARAARRGDAARPRVRAVPPDGDVPRPRLPRPAAADLRGRARRGRVPGRLRRQPVHAGRPRARRPRPARRGGEGDHPADERDRPPAHVARRPPPRCGVLGEALPDHPRHRPLARRRPGDRAAAGLARLPLRLGRRAHRPPRPVRRARPLRHRRGRLLRRARRQPAGLQLPARGAGLLPPDRGRAARRAAAVVGAGGRRPHRGPGRGADPPRAPGGDDLPRRRAAQRGGPGRGGRAARQAGRDAGLGGRPRVVGDHQPAHDQRRAHRRCRRSARRPAARTGARTSPTATTPSSPATSTS